jgi:hypothetical protein
MPMGYPVQTATTAQPIVFGPMVSSTDHLAAVTGITPTVTISKAGGSFASPAGAITEVGNGFYKIAGNATDNATVGPLVVHATGTGADPFDDVFTVVAYNPLSATNLGLSALPTANPAASGGLPTTDASNGVKVSVGTGTGQINAASGKVPATIASGDYSGNTVQTGDNFARLGAPAGASHAADIAAVKTDTTKLGTPAGASVSADIAAVKVDSAAIKAVTDGVALTNIIGTVTAATSATSFTVTLAGFTAVGLAVLKGRTAIITASTVAATLGGEGSVQTNTASGSNSTVITLYSTSPLPATPQVGDTINFVGAGATS